MKFRILVLLLVPLFSLARAVPEISVESDLGQHLLANARRVQEGENNNNNNNNNEAITFEWVAGYSVKFQGCHVVKQWNDNANNENDVRISSQGLVRFRLCPSSQCSATKASGCSKGYGDYVIGMSEFLSSFYEAKSREIEYDCQYYLQNKCSCQDTDDKDDGFNADYCEYDCFNNSGMTECVDRNPYQDDGQNQNQQFNLENYMQCTAVRLNNNNNGGGGQRVLEQNGASYYVGPYCSEKGGSIYLGLFTDDSCTNAATDTTFQTLVGFELPYSTSSIVGADCVSCLEREYNQQDDQNNQADANDAADIDAVSESCETLYQNAGKCENSLASGVVDDPNTSACTYMEGIRVVRQDGIIDTGSSRTSAVATALIVIFAMAFCAMAFYVWYLRTRLGVKQNTLL
jgi:hypothetical protein